MSPLSSPLLVIFVNICNIVSTIIIYCIYFYISQYTKSYTLTYYHIEWCGFGLIHIIRDQENMQSSTVTGACV